MDTKEAIAIAKRYVVENLEDERISNLGVEEIEQDPQSGGWLITLAFSRPWNSPRAITPAQAALEAAGIFSNLRRSYKTLAVDPSGQVLSMRNRSKADAE